MSAMALRLRLAVAMTSSWRQELPAATAFAVAMVMPFVMRIKSSGVEVLAGGTWEQNTCRGGGEGLRSGRDEARQGACACARAAPQAGPAHTAHTHGQLLADVLDGGLQRTRPLRGLVLHRLHRL